MAMRILLAGLNIDIATVEEAKALLDKALLDLPPDFEIAKKISDFQNRTVWSPETLSAAYARISRDPSPVPELREQARREVEAARKSNRNIIFGLGHSSVAEHAVFNFDVLGVSRLAMEEIEHQRLCSFTEKSQRYITLDDDLVVPSEVSEAGFSERFSRDMGAQFRDYMYLFERLFELECLNNSAIAKDKKARVLMEGRAKEDARYVLTLAVPGQLGLTANARNLELMISRLASHPLAEMREFAQLLTESAEGIAPSLIKYTEGAKHVYQTEAEIRELTCPGSERNDKQLGEKSEENVRLIHCPADGDDRVAAALLFGSTCWSMSKCSETLKTMGPEGRARVFKTGLRRLKSWNPVQRAFEDVYLGFELVVSASCFAQLKRHRMATLIAQDYNPSLGTTIPDSIVEAGESDRFWSAVERSEDLYRELRGKTELASAYALTNAHRRRVLFNCNLRELYHLARLRMDEHAQWDIRTVASRMVELAREKLPLATMMMCGKDSFESRYIEVFGAAPE